MSFYEEAKRKLKESGFEFKDNQYIITEDCNSEGEPMAVVNKERGFGFKVKEPFLCTVYNNELTIFVIIDKYSGYFGNGSYLTLREFYVCE